MSINIDFAHQKVHEGVGFVACIQPNSNLLIRLTNKAGLAKDLAITLDWYEVDLT